MGSEGGRREGRGGRFLRAYRRVRKPMPPPERVIEDKRRRIGEETARHEIEEAQERREGS